MVRNLLEQLAVQGLEVGVMIAPLLPGAAAPITKHPTGGWMHQPPNSHGPQGGNHHQQRGGGIPLTTYHKLNSWHRAGWHGAFVFNRWTGAVGSSEATLFNTTLLAACETCLPALSTIGGQCSPHAGVRPT
jgi:hypothetical protein